MQFRGLTKVLAINYREVGVGGGGWGGGEGGFLVRTDLHADCIIELTINFVVDLYQF